jgi:hypothetical protein
MTVARRLALLSALALTACVSTNDEPFSLDDGDAIAPAASGYVCASYDAAGKRIAAARRGRLIALRRNKKTQYAFVGEDDSSVEPFTLHRAKEKSFVVANARSDGAGENLYRAEFADAAKEFRLYDEADDFAPRAQEIARERGATLTHNPLSDDLSGPLDAQRASMIELASDAKGWRLAADCRAKPQSGKAASPTTAH